MQKLVKWWTAWRVRILGMVVALVLWWSALHLALEVKTLPTFLWMALSVSATVMLVTVGGAVVVIAEVLTRASRVSWKPTPEEEHVELAPKSGAVTKGAKAPNGWNTCPVCKGFVAVTERHDGDEIHCANCHRTLFLIVDDDGSMELGVDENPNQERSRHAAALRSALAFFEEWADVEDYGSFTGGDPRMFAPAEDESTEEQRAAHRASCEAWDRGERPDIDAGPVNRVEFRHKRRETGEDVVVPAGTAFVEMNVFGRGTVRWRDEGMVRTRDALRKVVATLEEEKPPSTRREPFARS